MRRWFRTKIYAPKNKGLGQECTASIRTQSQEKTDMNNKSSHSEIKQKTNNKKPRDPRDRVTPDAFIPDPDLIGKPLATPKRRAMAMGIDLLIIQQLSHIGSFVLGLSITGLLFMLASHRKKKQVGSGLTKTITILGFVVLFAVIANEIWLYQSKHEFNLMRDKQSEQVEEFQSDTDLTVEEQLEQAKDHIESLESDDSDIIDLIEQLAEQLGYGFGWAAIYFTLCMYLTNGQTMGKWICKIRVVQLDGKKIGVWAALGRYGGYAASFVTGLSGFFQIYWDANRQGLHDKVSSTVVICLRRDRKTQPKI